MRKKNVILIHHAFDVLTPKQAAAAGANKLDPSGGIGDAANMYTYSTLKALENPGFFVSSTNITALGRMDGHGDKKMLEAALHYRKKHKMVPAAPPELDQADYFYQPLGMNEELNLVKTNEDGGDIDNMFKASCALYRVALACIPKFHSDFAQMLKHDYLNGLERRGADATKSRTLAMLPATYLSYLQSKRRTRMAWNDYSMLAILAMNSKFLERPEQTIEFPITGGKQEVTVPSNMLVTCAAFRKYITKGEFEVATGLFGTLFTEWKRSGDGLFTSLAAGSSAGIKLPQLPFALSGKARDTEGDVTLETWSGKFAKKTLSKKDWDDCFKFIRFQPWWVQAIIQSSLDRVYMMNNNIVPLKIPTTRERMDVKQGFHPYLFMRWPWYKRNLNEFLRHYRGRNADKVLKACDASYSLKDIITGDGIPEQDGSLIFSSTVTSGDVTSGLGDRRAEAVGTQMYGLSLPCLLANAMSGRAVSKTQFATVPLANSSFAATDSWNETAWKSYFPSFMQQFVERANYGYQLGGFDYRTHKPPRQEVDAVRKIALSWEHLG